MGNGIYKRKVRFRDRNKVGKTKRGSYYYCKSRLLGSEKMNYEK